MKLNVKSGNAVVNDAAELLFERGQGDHGDGENPIVFADLTNAEKLALVQAYQKQVVVDLANTGKSQKAQTEARELEKENKHTI